MRAARVTPRARLSADFSIDVKKTAARPSRQRAQGVIDQRLLLKAHAAHLNRDEKQTEPTGSGDDEQPHREELSRGSDRTRAETRRGDDVEGEPPPSQRLSLRRDRGLHHPPVTIEIKPNTDAMSMLRVEKRPMITSVSSFAWPTPPEVALWSCSFFYGRAMRSAM